MSDERPKELTLHQCFTREQTTCEHEWGTLRPADDTPCQKCGMTFLAHVYMEMP